ncbi:MAG TPA: isoprenoid biosynthesis glyoxalase ElbB [Bdellovibrionales bacterium]|nr:isoprenoid biosynthesis glyoxalase ElbB [Bdellovibrionales bacterium]
MSKKIAVVLSGCGHKDGAEITEAVSALIALSEAGAAYRVFAPGDRFAVADPISGEPTGESRVILKEAARIARGRIQDLDELRAEDFDGLAFPGGFGAALHLCTFAKQGAACTVHPEAERVIREFHKAQKPIAAICIAPALVARVLGPEKVTLTIGNDKATATEIAKTGAVHEECAVDDFVSDRDHRIVSTPAYMYDDAKPHEVFAGVRGAMRELVEMA